jgi:RNA polymerase sigma factor (sigma-70 family)
MKPPDDNELLREYAAHNSEEAFTELVGRHVALVYSAALRQVREPQLAEEITQAVFIILARKARAVSRHPALSGWICRVAHFVSRDALRAERRRQHREQQIATQMQHNAADTAWMQIAPLLDEAVAQLGEKDRSAIVLRYYEQKSLGEVGGVLGVDADAAQKRVSRALEKLREFFVKRGVASTTAIIAGAISANSVQAAPAALAKSVAAVAVAKGAAASGSTLTLIKGALKLMAWTKVKTAVIAGVILAATTTGVVGYKAVQAHYAKPPLIGAVWDMQADGIVLMQATIEFINTSQKTMGVNDGGPMNSGASIERFTDGAGQAIKYTKEPGDNGNPFKYTYVLNKPVPPGGKIVLKMEGTLDGPGTGTIKPTGEPDVFELQANEQVGNEYVIHRINVFRLPPGAVLLEKSPADLETTTNGGRVELRMDKMLPPPGKSEVRIRYRLAAATK